MPSAEEDYLDRARELWQRYQVHVYIGLAMILATITGFTLEHTAYDDSRDTANAQLYALLSSADDGRQEDALAAFATLQEDDDFPELTHLGAFVLSSLHYDSEDYAAAAAVLQPALDGSEDIGLRQFAALRIAEAQIAGNAQEQAIALLQEHMPSAGRLRVVFEERIGDAEYSRGNLNAATNAYAAALLAIQQERGAQFYIPVLRIKLGAMLSSTQAQKQAREEAQRAAKEAEAEAEDEAAHGDGDSSGSDAAAN